MKCGAWYAEGSIITGESLIGVARVLRVITTHTGFLDYLVCISSSGWL